MSLSVIGVGFGRTGTMSLKLALERLGFGPCHHMEDVFAEPSQVVHWRAAAAGEAVDWDLVYRGYGSTTDWPGAAFWRELAAFYPDAKVILTTRPADGWWASYAKTIMRFLQDLPDDVPAHVRDICDLNKVLIGERVFGSVYDDREAALAAYRRHDEAVAAALPADRLLRFDVGEGWEPLCDFLERPVPDEAFPRSNSSAEFWENFSPGG